MMSSRGSINARNNYVRIFSFTTDSCKMTSYCRICAGPIENPPDSHDHCIACLGLAHPEAALEESDCAHCADLPLRVLRTRRNVARGLFGVRPTADNMPLVGPPPPLEGGDDNFARSHRSQRSPQSPVTFSDGCFCHPPSVADFVSFSLEGEEDSMSVSASEKEEWAESERDRSDSEGPSDLQEEVQPPSSRHENVGAVFSRRPRSARLRPNRRTSTQRHRPCFLRWTVRKPTGMSSLRTQTARCF